MVLAMLESFGRKAIEVDYYNLKLSFHNLKGFQDQTV